MPGITYSDGTNRTITEIYYQEGGSLRIITEVYYSDGGTVRLVWPASIAALVNDRTITGQATAPANATATYTLANTGVASGTTSPGGVGGGTYTGEWLLSGAAANYDVRATLLSGTTPTSGTLGTWLNLGTTRTWSMENTGTGVLTSSLLIEIRTTATGIVQTSASIALAADVA